MFKKGIYLGNWGKRQLLTSLVILTAELQTLLIKINRVGSSKLKRSWPLTYVIQGTVDVKLSNKYNEKFEGDWVENFVLW